MVTQSAKLAKRPQRFDIRKNGALIKTEYDDEALVEYIKSKGFTSFTEALLKGLTINNQYGKIIFDKSPIGFNEQINILTEDPTPEFLEDF